MKFQKTLITFLVITLLLCGCDYIVLPEGVELESNDSRGWHAVATDISETGDGKLRIDLTITNLTNDWSAMQAVENKPAVLTVADGKKVDCPVVYVGSGGHRLAPGFRIRGYTAGKRSKPETQLIYVECENAEISEDSTLKLDISYVTGEYNYYYQEENKVETEMMVELGTLAADLTYPIAEQVDGLIQSADVEMLALNDCILTLTDVVRSDEGFTFSWKTTNPGEYPTTIHVGMTPVVGQDGIFYGYYRSPDIPSVPMTPNKGEAAWDTEVAVPPENKGCYIMLSVESKKQRLFVNYAIDITEW